MYLHAYQDTFTCKKKSIYVFAYMCTIYESVLYYLIS